MIYQKAPSQGPRPYEPLRFWGRFTRYLEIGEDRYILRHVDLYENGHLLRYDRCHWVDGFGILAEMRYDEKKWEEWWGPAIPIDAAEFESVWRIAGAAACWRLQLAGALMSKLGRVPIWLGK